MTTWNIDSPTTEYFDHNSPGLNDLLMTLEQVPELAIDTETTGLNKWKDVPLYWSLAWGQRRMTLNTSVLQIASQRGPLFKDPTRRWIFANAKFDAHMLANVGIGIAGSLVDIQVQHALLYDDRRHGLKDINAHLFGWKWADFQDTFGKIGKKQSAKEMIEKAERENFQLLVEYAANDAWGTWCSYLELQQQLKDAYTHSLFRDVDPFIHTLYDLFEKIEVPYTKVLWKNERNGCLIDEQYLADIEPIAKKEIEDLERRICKEAGRVINPNSTAQLRDYFFNVRGFKIIKRTKGGKTGVTQPSLDSSTLEKFAERDPVAALVMEYRKLSKLYGTYITGIGGLLDPNGRVHTRYNQDVTRTGRLSSADPNLQNIPNVEKDKWKLRGAFIAGKGNRILTADYQQLEMRLLAAASMEPGMIDVINKGWDIHMGNAAMIFGLPYEDVMEAKKVDKMVDQKELPPEALTEYHRECLAARAAAKTIGFGLVYGMGPEKLANTLKISKAEAIRKTSAFMDAYPAVEKFKEEAVEETYATGYSFTILGRRRNVPQIHSNRYGERMQGERIAVNTPIQGSAADVVKMAQIRLDNAELDVRFDCHSIMQVHDELTHECPAEAEIEAMAEIKGWMEHPFIHEIGENVGTCIPLGVDIASGNTWLEAK